MDAVLRRYEKEGLMDEEVLLTGGRVTAEVVRKGNLIYRSMCKNSFFVHQVLRFLEKNEVACAPKYWGIDEKNREMLDYIDGTVPDNLGMFSTKQCCQAVQIIKRLHACLHQFPQCPEGLTVCHNDLSPCNFVFRDEHPIAVIDWDAAAFGHPLDDLAYAVWMWLDIGNEAYSNTFIKARMEAMLDAYGVPAKERSSFGQRIFRQMERVGRAVFPTEEQTNATRLWTERCRIWLKAFWENCYGGF
jgi:thiamine kinase-like enzyme